METITPELHKKKKIYPPGKSLGDTIKLEKRTSITFPDNQTNALLSPVVQATLVSKDKLKIKAVVFIAPEDQNGLDFDIYQNCYVDVNGKPQLQFFVCYDLKDVVGKIFDIYEVSFQAKKIPFEEGFSQIKIIQTFLWDIDPIASRGTETTVQPGTGF
ncbi:hypothetical protein GKZ90_0011575 [Flavobacterium sp. MC2016-06]|jgi:hypothetical protein|uniref:hypothetical protein n=1 Tax=Flavobacterium sp. MC2016-06 TaxID=2676308 RepID=UPI0012BAB7C4|nr:hypothetical protein [Flavobacterium sp. MC2016-06]MBU3858742.1 hypothetical protein [Flavobacterium sp. MC2016-06]